MKGESGGSFLYQRGQTITNTNQPTKKYYAKYTLNYRRFRH